MAAKTRCFDNPWIRYADESPIPLFRETKLDHAPASQESDHVDASKPGSTGTRVSLFSLFPVTSSHGHLAATRSEGCFFPGCPASSVRPRRRRPASLLTNLANPCEAVVCILKPGSPETVTVWQASSPVLNLVCGPEYNDLYRPKLFACAFFCPFLGLYSEPGYSFFWVVPRQWYRMTPP